MEKIKVEMELAKESAELAMGLGKFAAITQKALKDGWSIGQDLPVIMATALAELVPALQGAEKIPDEVKEDKMATAAAWAYGGMVYMDELKK